MAVVAAWYFGNHRTRALTMLQGLGYLSRALSASRLNRRLHALAGWLALLETLGELFAHGQAAVADFVIDSMPVQVCRRVRTWRLQDGPGPGLLRLLRRQERDVLRLAAAPVCTVGGVPVAFSLLPATACHDLTPVHELTASLPPGAWVYADKAYTSARDEASILAGTSVRLAPARKATMAPNAQTAQADLRPTIKTVNSQLESMGLQRLHARSTAGREPQAPCLPPRSHLHQRRLALTAGCIPREEPQKGEATSIRWSSTSESGNESRMKVTAFSTTSSA